MESLLQWIPLVIRGATLAAVMVVLQSWAERRISTNRWPRGEAQRAERIIIAFCGGMLALFAAEILQERLDGRMASDRLSWMKIAFGHNVFGWAATLGLMIPHWWVARTLRGFSRLVADQEDRLESLQRDQKRAAEPAVLKLPMAEIDALIARLDETKEFVETLETLLRRLPLVLADRLAIVHREALAILEAPPPILCLRRAIAALRPAQPNRTARSPRTSPDLSEARHWLDRWDPGAIETLLLLVDLKDWRGCLDAISRHDAEVAVGAAVSRSEMHAEIVQLVADRSESERLRKEARQRMSGSATMFRRRAKLELAAGNLDEAKNLIRSDSDASNWIRAATRTMPSSATDGSNSAT